MDTPPYSDISLQLSPSANALHVNGDHPSNALGHPNGASQQPGPSSGIPGSDVGTVDFRALYSSSCSALDTQAPPTLREILTAYKQKGDGDREMLLAMLNAKSAEDQRIASQLSLRRSMLEINRYSTESRSSSHSQFQYPHSHRHGHMYTYVPDESYALAGPNHHHSRQQHHAVSASPPAPPHTYASGYSSHNQSTRGHLRAVESPPLSATTQKGVLSAARVRPVSLSGSQSRGSVRLPDVRSQVHAVPPPQSQIPSHVQRRKRPRHSRSRSRSPGPMTTSPPHRGYTYTYTTHSAPHSHAHSELDAERSPYSSASDSGSPRSVPNAYVPRTMAIGSLLSTAKTGNSAPSSATISNSRANGRQKDEHFERAVDREQDLETEKEQDSLSRERKRDREER